jgi:hypothetical protein
MTDDIVQTNQCLENRFKSQKQIFSEWLALPCLHANDMHIVKQPINGLQLMIMLKALFWALNPWWVVIMLNMLCWKDQEDY